MLDQNDPDTPTVPSPPKRKAILPVAPPSASSKSTAPLPSPMQRKHDKDRETKSRRFISDLTRVRLRRRIQKIYQMATDVIDGYGDEYYKKKDKPLPQETVDKIMLLYHNRIERRCIEVGLTVEEEEQWDPEEATIDIYDLSDSGEESEEHDSDDVCFYSDMDKEDDKDDDDNANDGDDDEFGDDEDARRIAKWEHEIKSLRQNLASDLVILQRMTHSPNRKKPYNKFEEWSAWKTKDVNEKVDALNVKIQELKESVAARESPARKRNAKPTKS